jgi:RHH-type proline utilization regulon transcriptional repressor/proline dehydrogenase/delta 1-pyrroline-5-carboxylate dehydrogenase
MDGGGAGFRPFQAFVAETRTLPPARASIAAATRMDEAACLAPLLRDAALTPAHYTQMQETARRLVLALRAKGQRGGVEALVQEFALSSQEGVALMCLAEALLRIPDSATRDALIRDKIGGGDWRAHLGQSSSLFVNAATWGLMVTGRLAAAGTEAGLGAALARLVARGGEPVIRRGMDLAMRMMGEQFVAGETIEAALEGARRQNDFRHSFDMLGEAATTEADARRYLASYEHAIEAIGRASAGRGVIAGPGISVKLSALHPRYQRAQRARVMAELWPRLHGLALAAKRHDIGLNIDAEESERLDLSLDLLEALCHAPDLAGWNGIGFVVQAYAKRAPLVIDWIVALARGSRHRIMLRLVKGAYWDSEIKRAQVDGQAGFPVFTRKAHTDVCYLACARRLLAAPDAVFPQFATHNAQTLAAILAMAGPDFTDQSYEFQCLHGMGEALYEEVVGPRGLQRPARIYAPVGTHETLLAYLVRRLLENGANSSFVHRIGDAAVPVEALIADPVAEVAAKGATPHPGIAQPRDLFGSTRVNSAGLDLAHEPTLTALAAQLAQAATPRALDGRAIRNPADPRDVIGHQQDATPAMVSDAVARAQAAHPAWAATPPAKRAALLRRAADLLESETPALIALLVREGGKTLPNAMGEGREAVDFLRYDAAALDAGFDRATHVPIGAVACISPWNFPLAIFLGQVAAALAAGNAVLAKPAEETPLIAARAIALLHAAGVPVDVVQLLPGDGAVGAALVADPRIGGVVFTGSTAVARLIQRALAGRIDASGRPVPLIAETGGLNAMVVDSSALPEQVVADVIASAFDSAGQRCSALRLLCLQEDAADRVLEMLRGAMAELALGPPDRLATDIGPVISAEAKAAIDAHVHAMRARGHAVHALPLPPACAQGHFVAPTLIEIGAVSDLTQEVFGPVLHVLRVKRDALEATVRAVNATGYGLTFGVHSRIDEAVARLTALSHAGNHYVNRSIIGAVVGVQPFGGHGLSGTGPKAGGPLYLRRLLAEAPLAPPLPNQGQPDAAALALRDWLVARGDPAAARVAAMTAASRLGLQMDLPGPVGEANTYALHPRGVVLCVTTTATGLMLAIGAALATGNRVVLRGAVPAGLPPMVRARILAEDDPAVVLAEAPPEAIAALTQAVAAMEGPVRPVLGLTPEALAAGADWPLDMLLAERSTSANTAAAGGNATLMAMV